MYQQTIIYSADGLEMHGDLYRAGSGEEETLRPGVLVFPEAMGISDFSRERAQRLVESGYVALACDLHGGGAYYDFPAVMPLLNVLHQDPNKVRVRALAVLDALRAQPGVDPTRIAAVGFCFGGAVALELARSGASLAAVAGFHCTLRTQRSEDAARIRAKILVSLGADDPMIDAAQRAAFEDEMRAGVVDWQMHLYGGTVHSFTNPAAAEIGRPEALRYSPSATTRSWNAMLAFFEEAFI